MSLYETANPWKKNNGGTKYYSYDMYVSYKGTIHMKNPKHLEHTYTGDKDMLIGKAFIKRGVVPANNPQ